MRDCEEIDGAVVEQLGGAEYISVAHTYDLEMLRLTKRAEKRRSREVRHHFEMSLYGCAKALNEGFFHILLLALATYLAIAFWSLKTAESAQSVLTTVAQGGLFAELVRSAETVSGSTGSPNCTPETDG